MPQVRNPEDAMKEFGAIMRVEKIPGHRLQGRIAKPESRICSVIALAMLAGFVRLPKPRITRWTDQLRWAASGMMFTDYGGFSIETVQIGQRHVVNVIIPINFINGGFEERPRGISKLGCLVSTPWTHKSFIDKRRLTSQPGRQRCQSEED